MIDALTALRAAARRYLAAEARNPDAPHLPTLLQTAVAWMQEAFRRGATLEDIAAAIGLTVPPLQFVPPVQITADQITAGLVQWDHVRSVSVPLTYEETP